MDRHSPIRSQCKMENDLDTSPERKIMDGPLEAEWQIMGVRSVGRPKHLWRDGIVGQKGAVRTRIAKDKESWRMLVEGYFLQ